MVAEMVEQRGRKASMKLHCMTAGCSCMECKQICFSCSQRTREN
jgi:hypothetical protein